MHPTQHPQPTPAQAGGRFIHAGRDALQGCVEPLLAHGEKAVAVPPEQQQQGADSQGTAEHDQAEGQHAAGNGITQAGDPAEQAHRGGGPPAHADGQKQGGPGCDQRGCQRQGDAPTGQLHQLGERFSLQIRPALLDPERRDRDRGQGRQQAEQLGQQGAPPPQHPGPLHPAGRLQVPASTAPAQQPLRSDQHRHDRQGHQGEQGCSLGIALHLPTVENAR